MLRIVPRPLRSRRLVALRRAAPRGWVAAAGLLCALLLAVAGGTVILSGHQPADRPWLDASKPLETRVGDLLSRLTLAEKASLLYGVAPPRSSGAVGYVPGIRRLGVPPLVLSDGPVGLRDSARAANPRPATALPATVALAATFDPTLARTYGQVLGEEARARGVDVLYGPAMNIVRVPVGGRNFEYFSEDPYLTGQLAASYVAGVQSRRVAAQVKHFALNNQENDRGTASSNASERTIREIYLPGWESAVTVGHAWSVMCGNNRINGTYACQNAPLLRDVLQREWGFDGVVGSDYSATHSAADALRAGLDQSFTLKNWGRHYRDIPRLVRHGDVSITTVDERVRRVLRMMFRLGLFERRPAVEVDVAAHGRFARRVAEEGTVLLRNDAGLLPLRPASLRSVAVIGPRVRKAYTGGGGSSHVIPRSAIAALDGIAARAGSGVRVTGYSGSDTARAAAAAAAATVAVVVAGDVAHEGRDRRSMDLPGQQNDLIAAVLAANRRTVVVLTTGAPVAMPWLPRAATLVETWYPGQEQGAALAGILFGDADPSGRLPVTFPVSAAQVPSMGAPRYPAGSGGYDYTEGLEVGYRGFDSRNRTPLFPFGFGLSYTTFAFSRLAVAPAPASREVRVSFTITNTGRRTGVAVPQVYLRFPRSAGEPPRQLKAFARATLAAGARQPMALTLPRRAFQYWAASGWRTSAGSYQVSVGSSSRHLPLTASVRPPAG